MNFHICIKDCENDTIITQWRVLTLMQHDLKRTDDIASFWKHISLLKNELGEYMFKELTDFIFNVMCLPHSSAAAERKFFDLSLVKTKLRNKLEFKTVNSKAKEFTASINQHYVWTAKDLFN